MILLLLDVSSGSPGDHRHGDGQTAAGVGLVGPGATPQLPGRPADGAGVVPALWYVVAMTTVGLATVGMATVGTATVGMATADKSARRNVTEAGRRGH